MEGRPGCTRRQFARTALWGTGAFAIGRSFGASSNGDVGVAVVGLGNKGNGLANGVIQARGARLVALCDVDTNRLDAAIKQIRNEHGHSVDRYIDYRALLDNKDIDAVVIATPNHWHALQTVWACQAGKDVYVEKPVCHSLWEGRKMMEAASKYDRIVQSGLQNRSDPGIQNAFRWLAEGHLGKTTLVRAIVYDNRRSIGKRSLPMTPPVTCDYNLWLGPAEDEPIYRSNFHYDWHWMWNTGNGDTGNQGIHELDLLRWVLGDPEHPETVFSYGGRFAWNDAGDTPNMQNVSYAWNGGVPAVFELRNLWVDPETNAAANYLGRRMGIIVECEGGSLRVGRGGGIAYDDKGKRLADFRGDRGLGHLPGFIKAVNSRKQSDIACTLEQGYLSSCLAHLANASFRTGEVVSDKALRQALQGDVVLEESHERLAIHLGRWDIDYSKEPWTLGNRLAFNASQERFSAGGSVRAANALNKRRYRREFKFPRL